MCKISVGAIDGCITCTCILNLWMKAFQQMLISTRLNTNYDCILPVPENFEDPPDSDSGLEIGGNSLPSLEMGSSHSAHTSDGQTFLVEFDHQLHWDFELGPVT